MEEQEARGNEHDQAAKTHLVMLMQAGYPWHKAAATAGLQISRSTAYRLLQAVRTQGEAALQDGRHGHPAKLREAVLQWLQAFCRSAPQIPSREVLGALQERFGIHVSIGHLNRIRAQLGMGNHVGRLKKTANALFSTGSSVARGSWRTPSCRRCSRNGFAAHIRNSTYFLYASE